MVETKHTHCRDNRMLNKLAVSAPPTYNQEKHDSEDYFTADRRQTLCRHDGKQGLMGNGLRMSLARNKTSANRLDIIYDAGLDLYNMRFYRRTFSKKTFECKTKDIETHDGIYCDMLEEMFTMVTGLYTHF